MFLKRRPHVRVPPQRVPEVSLTRAAKTLIAFSFHMGRILGLLRLWKPRLGKVRIPRPLAWTTRWLSGLPPETGISAIRFAINLGFSLVVMSRTRFFDPMRLQGIRAAATANQQLSQLFLDLSEEGRRGLHALLGCLMADAREADKLFVGANAVACSALSLRNAGYELWFGTESDDTLYAIDLLAKLPSMEYGVCIQVKGRYGHPGIRCRQVFEPKHGAIDRDYETVLKGTNEFNELRGTNWRPVLIEVGLNGSPSWRLVRNPTLDCEVKFLFDRQVLRHHERR